MDRLQFRLATEEDAANLADLVNSAYRGDSSKKGWTTEADLLGGQRTDPETLRQAIKGRDKVFLLAFLNEELSGSVFLEKKNEVGYLGMLTVKPTLQASGLGRKILEQAEIWASKNWQCNQMEMTVITRRTELIDWYLRRGYQKTNRREAFPYGDEKFGLPKVPDLEFIVLEKRI